MQKSRRRQKHAKTASPRMHATRFSPRCLTPTDEKKTLETISRALEVIGARYDRCHQFSYPRPPRFSPQTYGTILNSNGPFHATGPFHSDVAKLYNSDPPPQQVLAESSERPPPIEHGSMQQSCSCTTYHINSFLKHHMDFLRNFFELPLAITASGSSSTSDSWIYSFYNYMITDTFCRH